MRISRTMRIAAITAALSLMTLVGSSSAGAAESRPVSVSGICIQAFTEATVAWTPQAPADLLDPAVRSCASLDEWLAAAEMFPTPFGDADPERFLDERCADEMSALAGYATCYSLGYRVVKAAPGMLSVTASRDTRGMELVPGVGVEIILDTSKSMLEEVDGVRRIDIAKSSLEILVNEALTEGLPVALRTFGGSGGGRSARCETSLTAPLAPLDRQATLDLVAALDARRKTKSPIAASLAAVTEDLADVEGSRTVVLVTDGDETCGGDPIAAIEGLVRDGRQLDLNIVGFALEDQSVRERMVRWAEAGDGKYIDAANADELAEAITVAVTSAITSNAGAPIHVLDGAGELIVDGTVGGDPLEIAPGTYRIEVLVDPPVEFAEVTIASGERVELDLRPPSD